MHLVQQTGWRRRGSAAELLYSGLSDAITEDRGTANDVAAGGALTARSRI